MARGRPKGSKNKPKQIQLFQETVETTVSEPEVSVREDLPAVDTPVEVTKATKEKPIKVNGYCTRCGKAIYSGVININLCALTGNASWSRACSVDKLTLCKECSIQLNEVVDNWVISGNPKLKKPYHIS